MIKRALISVSDKAGIVDFAKSLSDLGVELISTGGTYKAISAKGIPIKPIEEHTGSKEILDGRVKTLHPKIHGGILAIRKNEDHIKDLNDNEIAPIDLVVVNLYPFLNVIRKDDVTPQEVIENIDIGGVALLRASAKNFRDVAVVTDPSDYENIVKDLHENGLVSEERRFELALKAFQMTAYYDFSIFNYLSEKKSLFSII